MIRQIKYRADIDGLRAVAVLSVVVFHASPHLMPGGYTGVDIFFVISGYLISTVIFTELEDHSFSVLDFYARRVRRILRALLAVLVSVFAIGWFVLFGSEYRRLGEHVAAGAGFISNFIYRGEAGYFDEDAHTKILLHLWSLGIEEQFYIVWPALLMVAWRRIRSVAVIIVAVLIFSFAANIYLVDRMPAEAFYSPVSRAWELMVGCILAHLRLRGWRWSILQAQFASAAGVALIIAGFAFVNDMRSFPGWWALLPTAGTFLLISAGADAWLNEALSSRVLVGIGLLSYPIYLWHWPLLVLGRIINAGTLSRDARISVIGLSFVAAGMTYFLVERPIRRGKSNAKAFALLSLTLLTGIVGYICYWQNGFPGTGFRDAKLEAFVDYFDDTRPAWKFMTNARIFEKFRDECSFYDLDAFRNRRESYIPRANIPKHCTERDLAKRHVVMIWGDSHAQHLYWGLKQNLPSDWQILQVASSGCLPDPDVDSPSTVDYCRQSNWTALQTIAKAKPDVIVVAQGTGQQVSRFNAIEERMRKLGIKHTLFAGPTPHWLASLPEIVARRLWPDVPRRTFVSANEQLRSLNEELKRHFVSSSAMGFIDIQGTFCNGEGCLVYLGDDLKVGLTSMDDGHLLPIASEYLAKQLLARMIIESVNDQR